MGKAGSADWTVFQVDGHDLLPAKLQGASYKVAALQEATHGLGDRWEESTPTGMRQATVTQTGAYFDTSQNGIHDTFKDLPLTTRSLVLVPAAGAGSPLIAAGVLNESYEVLARLGNLTRANVTYVVTGAVDDSGALVDSPETVHTANWTSTPVDHGHATAGGGQATQLVTALSGLTGFVGTLEHSPDASTWATLVAFPNVTAAGTPATLAIAGPIDRYVRFRGTVAGTGSVAVAVSLTRL